MIATLKRRYDNTPIGYSGHEVGLSPTWAAVAMGATFVERHLTLDRAMWGTDQAASVEVAGFERLVRDIRDIERSLGRRRQARLRERARRAGASSGACRRRPPSRPVMDGTDRRAAGDRRRRAS